MAGFRITDVLRLSPEQLDGMLLLGAPGIGKTEVMLEYARRRAEEEGRVFADLKQLSQAELKKVYEEPERYYVYYRVIATHVFPEDVSIPRESGEYLIFKSPLVLSVLSRRGIRGLLFIDELTNVQRTDQRVLFYSLIQERELGWSLRLSDGITIVAAGNPPEVSSDANVLPAPLVNRLTVVEVEPPTLDEWARYMDSRYGEKWDRRVLAYLSMVPSDFVKPPGEPETLENFPTPRSWTNLSLKIVNAPPAVAHSIAVGCVGREVAARFLAFVRRRIPSLEELLRSPETWLEFETGQKYLAVLMVANNIDFVLGHANAERLFDVLMNEREFLVLMLKLMDPKKRVEAVVHPKLAGRVSEIIDRIKDFVF